MAILLIAIRMLKRSLKSIHINKGYKMQYQTKDGYIISEENYNKIKEICPRLSFDEIMRMIDLFKSEII